MNFKQAVLREFLCPWSSTGELHVALRADLNPSELSAYHQMVKKPGSADFTPEIVHAIAPHSSYEDVLDKLKDEFKHVDVIGETYDVAPYVIGWKSIGFRDERKLGDILQHIGQEEYFTTYIENWLDTAEGREALVKSTADQSNGRITEQEVSEFWQSDDFTEGDLRTLKNAYIEDYATPFYKEYADYKRQRLGEFYDAVKPLTEKQVMGRIQRYYNLSAKAEKDMRQANQANAGAARLLWGLWPM